MPRQARLDAPGALHHIIARGMASRKLFEDDTDRKFFLERLGRILIESSTSCYAWVLIPDHFHLLLRTGKEPIATVMRRLLTGYAVNFNRRHQRSGPLFHSRYKSVVCQESTYLTELVRYIHLNPARAKLTASFSQLDRYAYSGHGVLMGNRKCEWQDSVYVLQRFGTIVKLARRRYREFLVKGLDAGLRPDLTGGGLLRSLGGLENVKALRKENAALNGDERVLGDSDFVAQVLTQAEEAAGRKYPHTELGWDVDMLANRVAELLAVPVNTIWAAGRKRMTVKARSLLCYWAVRELGISLAELARRFKISSPAIKKSVVRGEKLAQLNQYQLTG